MLSTIGNYEFVRLTPPPNIPHQQVQLRTKPGRDGVELHRLGKWCESFALSSVSVASDVQAGFNLHFAYNAMIGTGTVDIHWGGSIPNGFDYLSFSVRFHVLSVELSNIKRVISGYSHYGDFGAVLHCRWMIQPVAV